MYQENIYNKTDSVGLFISLLVRYPEISSLNYEPLQKVIQMSFLLTEVISSEQQEKIREELILSLEGHADIIRVKPQKIDISTMTVEQCTFIEISRDVDTITREEINLLVELLKEMFPTQLMSDSKESFEDEDQQDQEDLIGYMLDNFRVLGQPKKYFAFRENGRVLVFNK